MIEHVYRRTAAAPGVDAVVVAADDERIVRAVEAFGGVATLTRSTHRTGTDRVAEVAERLDCAVILNVQGDEPFVEPEMLADLAAPLLRDPGVVMTTLRRAITDPADYTNPHVVKVVVDCAGDALYFSRAPLPYRRPETLDAPSPANAPQATAWHHIGLYGFRRDVLLRFSALPQTPLELSESLEQLRALEHGIAIRTIPTQYESIGVDTLDDLDRARRRMSALTARGGSLAAFTGRCIPAGCVAPHSHTPGMLGRRALPAGRLARLDATPYFHRGLLAHA